MSSPRKRERGDDTVDGERPAGGQTRDDVRDASSEAVHKRRRRGEPKPLPPLETAEPGEVYPWHKSPIERHRRRCFRKHLKNFALERLVHSKQPETRIGEKRARSATDSGRMREDTDFAMMRLNALLEETDAEVANQISDLRKKYARLENYRPKVDRIKADNFAEEERLLKAKAENQRIEAEIKKERDCLRQLSAENASKRKRLLEEGAELDRLLAENEAKRQRLEKESEPKDGSKI